MTAVLNITDGTTTIDLINGAFRLDPENGWTPARLQYKSGGTWADTAMADGRVLVDSRWANVVETFAMMVADVTQDDLIWNTQELGRLLEKAASYWKSRWQTEPVWIEARAACETNMRYATIKGYQTPQDDDPFSPSFMNDLAASFGEFILVVEHEPWQDKQPGQVTCVELSAYQDLGTSYAIEAVPEASADDAVVEHNAATISLVGQITAGSSGAPASYDSGIRFKNVNIPAGVTVTSAYITFTASASIAGVPCPTLFYGEASVTPAAYTTYANFVGRALTVANVAWAVPAFVVGSTYNSPSLIPIVNEIIALPAWAAGSDLAIQWQDDASANYRTANSWDTASGYPVLHVTYTLQHYAGVSTPTCDKEIFVANKQNVAQLSHVFIYDNAPGVYSANLIHGAKPLPLFPAAPLAGDIIYFGIDTTPADTGPFNSIVFDIGTAQAALTIIWEYYDSGIANWAAITASDGTSTAAVFDTTGINVVVFDRIGTSLYPWGTVAVNGVTGYWVRARLTVVGGGAVVPTQIDQDFYTVTWPYIEIESTNPAGDIAALMKYKIRSCNYTTIDKIVSGSRSLSRGDDFTAYLNFADEQNPANVTVAVAGAGAPNYTTFADFPSAPSGRAVLYSPGAIAATPLYRTSIRIGQPLLAQYSGVFRLFIRCLYDANAGAGVFGLQAHLSYRAATAAPTGVAYWTSEVVSVPQVDLELQCLDFGVIRIAGDPLYSNSEYVYLTVYASATDATPDLYIIDAITMPADEFSFDLSSSKFAIGYNTADGLDYLLADSASVPKNRRSALSYDTATGYSGEPWIATASYPFALQANAAQRVWFLSSVFPLTTHTESRGDYTEALEAWRIQRYLSMRGNR